MEELAADYLKLQISRSVSPNDYDAHSNGKRVKDPPTGPSAAPRKLSHVSVSDISYVCVVDCVDSKCSKESGTCNAAQFEWMKAQLERRLILLSLLFVC